MRFVSKRKRFRLVLKPSTHVVDAYGQKVTIPGLTIEFVNGRYETEDPDIIDMMLKSPFKGSQFIAAESDADIEAWIAAHPEYKHEVAQMITGGIATVNVPSTPHAVAAAQGALREAVQDAALDLDKLLEAKINDKLNPLLQKLETLLDASAKSGESNEAKAEESKQRKVFTCPVPGCGQVFRSGIEVGEHKRLAHSAPASE